MPEINPTIAVIILSYNDKNNLKEAFDSVLSQEYDNFELIYIDNDSRDGSKELVKKYYPGIRKFFNEKNIGYAAAYNQALRKIFQENFDGAVLLNSDVIVDKKWLLELSKSAFSDKNIGIAQPRILIWNKDKTDKYNSCGNKIHFLGMGYCGDYKKIHTNENAQEKDREIAYASGCSLLIKKEVFFETGGLDEDFFAYLEDQDLGWRARLLGYKIILSSKSFMWHKYHFQKNPKNKLKYYLLERNRLFFITKNFSCKTIFIIFPAFVLLEIGILFDSLLKGYFKEKIKSYFDFLANFKIILEKRTAIQKKRKIKDGGLSQYLNPTIEFEEVDSPLLWLANRTFRVYYSIVKSLI